MRHRIGFCCGQGRGHMPGSRVRVKTRDNGVLIGTTGRHANVLKIRPPLCLTHDEADLIAGRLDEVLGAVAG
jgi:4-aminobutyrate aminotransferase-like enzyme